MSDTVHNGDALAILRTLASESVDCCVTSPPYWGLRDYGHEGQLGLEPTPEAYVEAMRGVFREVFRVLKPQGTLWLNLGDSYSRAPEKGGSGTFNGRNLPKMGYGGAQSAKVGSSDRKVGRADRPGTRAIGLKPKDLVGVPWRVAFALQSDGWYLRQDIIWHKPNPMPESVTDRCTKAHEYLFLLAKSERYFYDQEAVKEAAFGQNEHDLIGQGYEAPGQTPNRGNRGSGNKERKFRPTPGEAYLVGSVPWEYQPTRNRRSVWTIPTKPFKGAHFAVMPEALVEPCIGAGCPVGGTVLDPFTGSGTVGAVALRMGRSFVGIEINAEYHALASKRIAAALPGPFLFKEPA